MFQVTRRTLARITGRQKLWNGNREPLRNLWSWDPNKSIIRWAWTQHPKYQQRYGAAMVSPELAHLAFVRLTSHAAADRWLDEIEPATPAVAVSAKPVERVGDGLQSVGVPDRGWCSGAETCEQFTTEMVGRSCSMMWLRQREQLAPSSSSVVCIRISSQCLSVAEELVVLVVAALSCSDVGEVGDELDALDPYDLLEADLDLVTKP